MYVFINPQTLEIGWSKERPDTLQTHSSKTIKGLFRVLETLDLSLKIKYIADTRTVTSMVQLKQLRADYEPRQTHMNDMHQALCDYCRNQGRESV
ncbi:hypothetical protein [Oligella urethralis]|uniref:hypothetical protein n=1 Tax=Oligella urethralis TaxID=90245 RepID=UPI00288A5F32|nr:hypothetical protein [Oligella urethralis]